MNTITIIHGDKGGVGKSFCAMAYLDWRLSRREPVVAVESDTRNPDIQRMFENHCPVFCANLAREEGWIDLANELESADPEAEYVISMPAGIGADLSAQMALVSDVLSATDRSLRAIWVLGETVDSITLLADFQKSLETLEAPSELVVARNLFWETNNIKAFDVWFGSKTRKSLINSGITEIDVPAMNKRVTLDQPPSVLMPSLRLGDRLAMARWSKIVDEQFGQLESESEVA